MVSLDGSISRGLGGIGGAPGAGMGGAGVMKCVTTYICAFDNSKCKNKKL